MDKSILEYKAHSLAVLGELFETYVHIYVYIYNVYIDWLGLDVIG